MTEENRPSRVHRCDSNISAFIENHRARLKKRQDEPAKTAAYVTRTVRTLEYRHVINIIIIDCFKRNKRQKTRRKPKRKKLHDVSVIDFIFLKSCDECFLLRTTDRKLFYIRNPRASIIVELIIEYVTEKKKRIKK